MNTKVFVFGNDKADGLAKLGATCDGTVSEEDVALFKQLVICASIRYATHFHAHKL